MHLFGLEVVVMATLYIQQRSFFSCKINWSPSRDYWTCSRTQRIIRSIASLSAYSKTCLKDWTCSTKYWRSSRRAAMGLRRPGLQTCSCCRSFSPPIGSILLEGEWLYKWALSSTVKYDMWTILLISANQQKVHIQSPIVVYSGECISIYCICLIYVYIHSCLWHFHRFVWFNWSYT